MSKKLDIALIILAIFWLGVSYFYFSGEFQADAAGNTYYVKTNGNNNSNGLSWGTAWQTLEKAMTVLQAGDTVLVADGTYYPASALSPANSGTAQAPIIIKTNGSNAIIDGTATNHAFWINSRNYITIDGFKFQNLADDGCFFTTSSVPMVGLTFKNLYANQACSDGFYFDNTATITDLVFENITLLKSGSISMQNVNNVIVRDSYFDCGEEFAEGCSVGFSDSNNVLIEDNEFRYVSLHTVQCTDSDDITVRNNIFYRVHDVKIDGGNNIDVLHNTFILDSPGKTSSINAPDVYGATDVMVKDNLFVEDGYVYTRLSELTSDYNYWVNTSSGPTGVIINNYNDLSNWQSASGQDTHSHQDKNLTRYDIFIDSDGFDFTPKADTWICNPTNYGSDGQSIGALSCTAGGGGTPTCSDGAIVSECLCGGQIYGSGYCCAGVYQATACNVNEIIASHSPDFVAQDSAAPSIILTITTNYNATCKYDTNSGTSYASMPNNLVGSSTTHIATLANLESGNTYNYYVRCSASFGTMTSDYEINYRILPEVNDYYPKLGLVMHPCVSTQEGVANLAKYDLVVLHKNNTWDNTACTTSYLSGIRSLNPKTKIFVHLPQSYFEYIPNNNWPACLEQSPLPEGCTISASNILYPLLNGIVMHSDPTNLWMMTDTAGTPIMDQQSTWSDAYADITKYCPPDHNSADDWDWNHQNVNYAKEVLMEPGLWDGIFWDSLYNSINWKNLYIEPDIDLNHDGSADAGSVLDAEWTAGVTKFYELARQYLGDDLWMMGNGYHYQYGQGNGLMIEGFDTDPATWNAQVQTIRNWQDNGQSPVFNLVMGLYSASPAIYRSGRFVLGTTLLTDAYFELRDQNGAYDQYYWLDEFAVDMDSGQAVTPTSANNWQGKGYLGAALSEAVNLGLEPSNHPNGVWRRDFTNGIVLVNPNDSFVTVNLGENYRKISGTQDHTINSGAIVSQVTLSVNDAIILLNMEACIEDWQCTAWSSCGNNQQTRTCTDANSCGTEINKPEETQVCDSTAPSAIDDLIAD